MESNHFKGEGLRPIVGRTPKGDGQIDLPERHGLLSRHDAMKGCSDWPDARSVNAHSIERLEVHDVEALPPSISTLVSRFVPTIGSTMSGYCNRTDQIIRT